MKIELNMDDGLYELFEKYMSRRNFDISLSSAVNRAVADYLLDEDEYYRIFVFEEIVYLLSGNWKGGEK